MEINLDQLRRFKPAVHKEWLYLSAGFAWFGVGVLLISFAVGWLKPDIASNVLLLVSSGLALAGCIYYFGFSKLAKKNINRIGNLKGEKVCLFAFQGWTSYPLVLIMMSLGIYLRTYSPIPKSFLAILYLGIGGGLFSASLHYFEKAARVHHKKNPETKIP
ncbi:MAG: hypothetical protein ACD_34C00250G0006 [uncultured bacterium]|nr:MAG: hypothetical protein ACD_34C00250G0006 [uncultured bacterium]